MISTRVGTPAVSFARTGVLRLAADARAFRALVAAESGVTESKRSARRPPDSTADYNSAMSKLSITWLGHATFTLRTPGGKRVIVDPWVTTNPSCPEGSKKVGDLDLMLVTHGHSDHTSDVVSIARASGAQVVAPFELSVYFQQKGLKSVVGMNPGGTLKT